MTTRVRPATLKTLARSSLSSPNIVRRTGFEAHETFSEFDVFEQILVIADVDFRRSKKTLKTNLQQLPRAEIWD